MTNVDIAHPTGRDGPFRSPELADTHTSLRRARHLPARYYTDPAILELEKKTIFLRDWLCLGRAEEIENPGEYKTFSIVNEPIVVARDEKGAINAFANVCAHRGTALVNESGRTKRFSCPYHGWVYDLAGRLVNAPYMEESDLFDPKSCRLAPVRAEVWQGWIFVNFDPSAPSLTEFLGTMGERMDFLHCEELRLSHTYSFELDCNWKLVVENFMDLYHLRVLHAESFGATVDAEAFAPELMPDGRYAARFHAGVMTPTGKSLFGQLPCFEGQPETASLNAFVGPNFQLFARNDSVFVWCAWPITADRTLIIFYTTFPTAWHKRADFGEKLEVYRNFEKLVASEDNAMVASLQRALKTSAFRPGLMSKHEVMLHNFIVGYLDRMARAA